MTSRERDHDRTSCRRALRRRMLLEIGSRRTRRSSTRSESMEIDTDGYRVLSRTKIVKLPADRIGDVLTPNLCFEERERERERGERERPSSNVLPLFVETSLAVSPPLFSSPVLRANPLSIGGNCLLLFLLLLLLLLLLPIPKLSFLQLPALLLCRHLLHHRHHRHRRHTVTSAAGPTTISDVATTLGHFQSPFPAVPPLWLVQHAATVPR